MNQLDATMIYLPIRSAQDVSGNICTMCNATAHRLPTHNNNRIPHAVNISVSRSWWWAKYCP